MAQIFHSLELCDILNCIISRLQSSQSKKILLDLEGSRGVHLRDRETGSSDGPAAAK